MASKDIPHFLFTKDPIYISANICRDKESDVGNEVRPMIIDDVYVTLFVEKIYLARSCRIVAYDQEVYGITS